MSKTVENLLKNCRKATRIGFFLAPIVDKGLPMEFHEVYLPLNVCKKKNVKQLKHSNLKWFGQEECLHPVRVSVITRNF